MCFVDGLGNEGRGFPFCRENQDINLFESAFDIPAAFANSL